MPSEAVEDHRFCTDCWEAAGRLGACCEAIYTLVLTNIAMENHNFFIGKISINGQFSMAMLNNQMVDFVK